jgi:predicted nicotinamide N-methyase
MFTLDFRHTKNVYIIQYMGTGDVFYNPDISCLSRWCQASGWKIPQPIEALVRDNTPFWKHMWEVLLVDSPYLDDKYGLRKSLDMRFQSDLKGRMEGPDEEETL